MSLLQMIASQERELARLKGALDDPGQREARRELKRGIADLEEAIRTLEAQEVDAVARAEELASEQTELANRLRHVKSAEGARDYRQASQIEHESEMLQEKLDAVEETELELMEESEERKRQITANFGELEAKRTRYVELLAEQESARVELATQLSVKDKELTELVAQLPGQLGDLIRKAREQGTPPCLAIVTNGYCGNCHMALSSSLRGKVMGNRAELQRCEECGVLLIPEDEGDL